MVDLDKIISLCKRRGFIFQGSGQYGGLQGTWDYGPLGVELKNNVKHAWWKRIVHERDDMEGLDCAIMMNRLVLKYSGHEDTFSDPMVDCRKCKKRFREDQADAEEKCSEGGKHDFTDPRPFNLMFKTQMGATTDGINMPTIDTNPQIMRSFSDDGGRTFSNETSRSLGRQGEYIKRQIWNSSLFK